MFADFFDTLKAPLKRVKGTYRLHSKEWWRNEPWKAEWWINLFHDLALIRGMVIVVAFVLLDLLMFLPGSFFNNWLFVILALYQCYVWWTKDAKLLKLEAENADLRARLAEVESA